MNFTIQNLEADEYIWYKNYCETEESELISLGFKESGVFKTESHGWTTYFLVFLHEESDIFISLVSNGSMNIIDVSSLFNNNISLTTTNRKNLGNGNFPKGYYLQIFPNQDFKKLFELHKESEIFLSNYYQKVNHINYENYLSYQKNVFENTSKTSIQKSNLKVFINSIFFNYNKYMNLIEDQELDLE